MVCANYYASSMTSGSTTSSMPPVPNKVSLGRPTMVSSCCCSSVGSFTSFSNTTTCGGNEDVDLMSFISNSEDQTGDNYRPSSSKFENSLYSPRKPCPLKTKLELGLEDVREFAQLGKNATLRYKSRLPKNITRSDIFVHVELDLQHPPHEHPCCDRKRLPKMDWLSCSSQTSMTASRKSTPTPTTATAASHAPLECLVRDAIQDDLRSVYSADRDSAKLCLCVVLVVISDGSFMSTLQDKNRAIGLSEIGLVWRLFEADDLTVYDGGVVVQKEEIYTHTLDFATLFNRRGRQCLLERLSPRVANEIMIRITETNPHLLMEV